MIDLHTMTPAYQLFLVTLPCLFARPSSSFTAVPSRRSLFRSFSSTSLKANGKFETLTQNVHFPSVFSPSPTESPMSSAFTTSLVDIDKPTDQNVLIGTTHFIKTVDDIHEALVSSVPGIKFGLGFCEASGDRLVRYTGTDDTLIELAKKNALSIACGHSFILFLGPPTFPVHVLNTVKMVPEVCHIYCATANEVQVIVGESSKGRGIMGVIDGKTPVGVESEDDIKGRRELLKKIGYKL